MTKYARKNQLKHAETQGNKEQIAPGETGSRKMTKQFEKKHLKQIQNQSQTEYIQSNEPKTICGEAGKQNRIKIHSQDGRSMVEMLGVLAIIGVLSLGGIVGYRLAMNHYQANQIAHEMNMMRTDAQIKIAQGTEKLTLGAPYDENKINFNGYETAFGCKYVDENDIISDETVSCQIANAYFIELPKIPDGVCQPLIRLINGMDNLIAFSVNDSEYEEGGTCQEGENDLYAVFSGETVSDLTHCERDDDCKELESTPFCDETRHVCVECTADDDCPYNTDYCENNVCKTCDSGVWNGTSCVECTEDGDCLKKGTEKPICNENNKCEPCPNRWSDTLNKCVTCTADEHCTDKEMNPVCNMNTGECELCPEGESWSDEFKECVVTSCHTNQECNVNGKSGYYCFMRYGYACDIEFSNEDPDYIGGQCRRVKADLISEQATDIGGENFYGSGQYMTWYSACRFCAAQTGGDESQCLDPASQPQFMGGWEDIDWQCYNDQDTPDISKEKMGYCKAEAGESPSSPSVRYNNVSSIIQEFIKMYGGEWHYLWMRNKGPGCDSWVLRLNSGSVIHRNRYYPGKAGGDNPFCHQIKQK